MTLSKWKHKPNDNSNHDHTNNDHTNHDHTNYDHINHDHNNHDHINHDHINHDHINHDHINHDHIKRRPLYSMYIWLLHTKLKVEILQDLCANLFSKVANSIWSKNNCLFNAFFS